MLISEGAVQQRVRYSRRGVHREGGRAYQGGYTGVGIQEWVYQGGYIPGFMLKAGDIPAQKRSKEAFLAP